MTIFLPKKPFTIIGKILYHITLWSWIPILFILQFFAQKEAKSDLMLLAIPFCFFQIFFSIYWLIEKAQEKHWIAWRSDNISQKESRT